MNQTVSIDEKVLADLFVANDDFAELERTLNVFCPFEAAGMVSQEIRHGYFLSYIFDPNRPHGFGSNCVRALMASASRAEGQLDSSLSLLDVHLMDFDSAVVRREWRDIDILIDVPDQNLVVVIELKINAREHSGQLKRYKAIVAEEWPERRHLFLFLTKRGDEPSESDGSGWLSIDLDTLARELGLVVQRGLGDPDARMMLAAYLAMLGRHHLSNERMEMLANSLWAKHREALEFLSDRRPDAIGDLFQRLIDAREALATAISTLCAETVIPDAWRPASVRFAVPSWDAIEGFCSAEGYTASNRLILLELVKAGPDYFRCYFQLGKGPPEIRERLFHRLRESGANVGKRQRPTKEWNRLASMTIQLKDLDESPDIDALSGRIFAQVRDFAAKHIPAYTIGLRELM